MGRNPWGRRNTVITVDAETVQTETQTERRWTSNIVAALKKRWAAKKAAGKKTAPVKAAKTGRNGKRKAPKAADQGASSAQ